MGLVSLCSSHNQALIGGLCDKAEPFKNKGAIAPTLIIFSVSACAPKVAKVNQGLTARRKQN